MSLKKDAAAPASDSGNMGCRTSRDCSGGMEFCHPVRHTCAECLSSTDCEDSRVCTADGICARPCTTSDDCDSEQDGICDPAVHLCTGCRSDADCSRGENPRCVAGRCVSD